MWIFNLRKVLNQDQTQRKLKNAHTKNFFALNDLYQTIVHLNTLIRPLSELLQKEVDFHWTRLCNEAFQNLKLSVNSDTSLSCFQDLPFTRL